MQRILRSGRERRSDPGIAEALELLMQALAGGEVAALSRLYALTEGRVFALAMSRLRCQQDAEEITVDVFTHVWLRAKTFDPKRGTVMAWLSVITTNRAIDRLRCRRTDISLDDQKHEAIAQSLPASTLNPEKLVSLSQDRHALHQALQLIDSRRRTLIQMSFFEGISHEEISVASGLPLGTVKSHLRRSLAVLRHSPALQS